MRQRSLLGILLNPELRPAWESIKGTRECAGYRIIPFPVIEAVAKKCFAPIRTCHFVLTSRPISHNSPSSVKLAKRCGRYSVFTCLMSSHTHRRQIVISLLLPLTEVEVEERSKEPSDLKIKRRRRLCSKAVSPRAFDSITIFSVRWIINLHIGTSRCFHG